MSPFVLSRQRAGRLTAQTFLKTAFLPQLLLALLFFFSLAGTLQTAHAQSTAAPAGTSIGNQATATYTDGAGVTRTSSSNVVTTTVQQVAAVDLIDNRIQSAGPGSPVYFPHTVTNNGNGADTFTLASVDNGGDNFNVTPVIYADANSDGVPDNNIAITTTGPLLAGQAFNFVVAGVVPVTATAGQSATVGVSATSAFNGSVSDSNTDTVNVTNNAAITVVKAIDDSSGPSPSGPYTYTLTYTNSGAATATNLVLTDSIPTGMTYVSGSGTWSLSATPLNDSNDPADSDPAGIDYFFTNTGNGSVTATIASVPAGTSGRVTFQVNVNSGVAPGIIQNIATFAYNDGVAPRTGSTNANTFTVTRTVNFDFDGPATATATAPQGGSVDFINTLTNFGSGEDSFDITVNAPGTFPAGTTFQLLKAGGGALLDSNGNGIPDSGPLAAGASTQIILRAQLPANATGNNGGLGFTITKTARSFADPTVIPFVATGNPNPNDTATDKLTAISANSVDITNTPNPAGAGAGAGPEVNPVTTVSGNPGSTVTFELDIQNTGPAPDTYILQSSATSSFAPPVALPAGWTIVFRDNTNTVVTNTGVLLAGATRTLFADITIPAGTAPGNVEVFFRALSPTSGAADIIHDRVTVNTVRSITVAPDNNGQVFAGNSIVYSHTVTNNGNVTETNIAMSSLNSSAGFTSITYPDTNNNGILDPAEVATPLLTIPTLAPGASTSVFVKVFAPAGATLGTTNITTVTAAVGGGGPTDSATDTTLVVTGDVRLLKEQAIDLDGDGTIDIPFTTGNQTAPPGAIIRYRITASNTGAGPVTGVAINDTTPSFTAYDNGDGTLTAIGVAAWTINGTTFTAASTVPTDGTAGPLVFTVGTLIPGQSAIATFGVKVRQ